MTLDNAIIAEAQSFLVQIAANTAPQRGPYVLARIARLFTYQQVIGWKVAHLLLSELAAECAVDGGKKRTCRHCGCTEEFACRPFGVGCHWVSADVCSACVPLDLGASTLAGSNDAEEATRADAPTDRDRLARGGRVAG